MDLAKQVADYMSRQQTTLGEDGKSYFDGPTPDVVLATPIFKFPSEEFPYPQAVAMRWIKDYVKDLGYSTNPVEVLENEIADMEETFGIKTEGSKLFFNVEKIAELGFDFCIHSSIVSLDQKPLGEHLTEVKCLPVQFQKWDTDPEVWNEFYEYISDRVAQVYLLQHMRRICADLKSGKGIGTDYDDSVSSDSFNLDAEFNEHPSHTKAIAWMDDGLNLIKPILALCTENGSAPNFGKAARLIQSINGMPPNVVRPILHNMYHGGKNNPLNSADNRVYVEKMKAKYRLKK